MTETEAKPEIKTYTDFMCDCMEAGKERCKEVRDSVKEALSSRGTDRNGKDFEVLCTDANLLSAVIYNNQDVSITGIPSDMWARIDAKLTRHIPDDEYDERYPGWEEKEIAGEDIPDEWETCALFEIKCDRIEDGIARLHQLAQQAKEEWNEANPTRKFWMPKSD